MPYVSPPIIWSQNKLMLNYMNDLHTLHLKDTFPKHLANTWSTIEIRFQKQIRKSDPKNYWFL